MVPEKWRNEAWFDAIKLALAAFLFATPWIYRFTSEVAASRNAWACGVVIGIASIWAIVAYSEWEEWGSLLLGAWIALSPWALGFAHTVVSAMWANVAIGAAIIVLTLADLWMMRRTLPHVTA